MCERVGETLDEVVTIVDDAYAALAARVDRLQDCGEPDAFELSECLIGVCNYGELGLRYFVSPTLLTLKRSCGLLMKPKFVNL